MKKGKVDEQLNQKTVIAIIVVGILLLLLAGIGGYTIATIQPSPIETLISSSAGVRTNLKTYQSKRFFITFSYPSKYVLVNDYENTYSDQGFIHLYTQEGYELVKSKAGRGGPDFIQIGVYSNPKNLTALEWAKSDTARSNFTGTYAIEKIAGEDALSYSFEGMGTGVARVMAQGNYIYTFDVMGNPEMTEDFKQILQTVEFVK